MIRCHTKPHRVLVKKDWWATEYGTVTFSYRTDTLSLLDPNPQPNQ